VSVDDLARGLADGTMSRRRALGVFAGAAAATLVGAKTAKAQPGCRQEGHPCEGNQECCPGLECRVTGPGNAERCARPVQPPPKPKKCHGKCSNDSDCGEGCKCHKFYSKKCKCWKGFCKKKSYH
jgi:hypothetical protein